MKAWKNHKIELLMLEVGCQVDEWPESLQTFSLTLRK